MKKTWNTKSDDADDKKRGIKEHSKRDQKLDKQRGVPDMKPSRMKGAARGR